MGLTLNISGIYKALPSSFPTNKYSLAYSVCGCTLTSMCADKVPSVYGCLLFFLGFPG